MFSKMLFVSMVTSSLLFGVLISNKEVNNSLSTISLASCDTYHCIESIENIIKNENYYIKESGKYYLVSLVNIKDEDSLKTLEERYIKTFPDLIVKKKNYNNNKPIKETIKKEPTKKDIFLENYTKALELYKVKEYQKSNELLNILFQDNLNDPNINFYIGRTAYELQKYHEAIIAYERVLFEQPDSIRTKFELARTHLAAKAFNESKQLFLELSINEKVPNETKQLINKYLIVIDKNIQKHFLNGVLLFGVNYDSNVNNKANDDIFNNIYIPAFDTYIDMNNSTPDNSDWAHQEVVILNHKYKYNDTTTLKNDLMLFTKTMNNKKNSSKDIDMVSYTFAVNKLYPNTLSVDYGVFTDALWIDDKSNLKTYGIFPKFKYPINPKLNSSGHFKYQIKRNQTDSNQDSKYMELNYALQYKYLPVLIPSVTTTYTKEKKEQGILTSIDKQSLNLKLSATYMYQPNLSIVPTLSRKDTKYSDTDASYLVKQKDTEYKFGIMNTYIYSPLWLFQAGFDYTNNNSNITSSEYNKHTISFNIIRPF